MDHQCQWIGGHTVPVGAIFLNEIAKFTSEMNDWINAECLSECSAPFILSKMVSRVVWHELFHEIYVASPKDYDPDEFQSGSNYRYCHDSDDVCQCIMNQGPYKRVYDLINQTEKQCYTACVIANKIQDPCIEQHNSDLCPWVFILGYNPAE